MVIVTNASSQIPVTSAKQYILITSANKLFLPIPNIMRIFATRFELKKMVINHSKLNIIFKTEELYVATRRNAKLRYDGYKKLSEM